jgi:pilus assembly protein CpaF
MTSGPLVDRVRDLLVANGRPATPAAVAEAVRQDGAALGDVAVHRLVQRLRDDLVGLGPLQAFVDDPRVTDVLVNGAGAVWLDRGSGLLEAPAVFDGPEAVRALAVRLAAAAGRRLDEAAPFVDVRFGDGIRLHAVLPPVAPDGPLLSVRIPRHRARGLADLAATGAFGDGAEAWVRAVVQARAAFLVSGGTGSGKTTLTAAMLGEVPADERIVLVEDSAELAPAHPHVVRLEARTANAEGAGSVSLQELVRQALRMRPDRLVVGEARGAEVADLLGALNTGHEGGCGTLHANAAHDVPARVAALASLAGLSRDAAMQQLATAIDVVLHLHRGGDGVRRLRTIGVLVAGRRGVRVVPALEWSDDGGCRKGPGFERLHGVIAR